MSQFASRLAPPSDRPASRPNAGLGRQRSPRLPPQSGYIYDNGPINGTVDAWPFNLGFVISDTFTVSDATNVTGITFGAWLFPGDVLETAEVSITSQPDGGTVYFDQTVGNFTQTGCAFNQQGYNVCSETSGSFQGPMLQPGTYWVNLQNAVIPSGDPVFWDQNSGVGCTSPGCPSQASDSAIGTIPSESFALLGDNPQPPACFRSQGNLQILYNFTLQQTGANGLSGVTIDRAGNLYGTTNNGGGNGDGFAYKLARSSGWLFDPLFSFSGANNGDLPSGVIVGPNGSLYGGAQGGIQNCGTGGSQYCGLVFNLRPHLTVCPSSQCGWTENVPYRFSSESDGSGIINVSASDLHGNLYGTTTTGGTYDQGTVFELTPSDGGWTKTTLYSFTGHSDGFSPNQVLVGNDGNLYGVTGDYSNSGTVFQLTPSGGQWTESVLHNFAPDGASNPTYLVQDRAGNLYGTVLLFPYGTIFTLQKKNSGWAFSEYFISHGDEYDNVDTLAIDASGNLYGTGSGGQNIQGPRKPGRTNDLSYYSYIFKAWYASDGWHYEDLNYLGYQTFQAFGSLALDASGNLYGTTSGCGTYGFGTVWQLSP